mgnify:CR=1 FL=1
MQMLSQRIAVASSEATKGNATAGSVKFTQAGDKVLVSGEVTGLKPGAAHGFHVHEKGDCSSGDGMSTGGHFKRNEGRISALLPGFTTRSNFFTIYAYGEVGKKVNGSFQEDGSFYTKTLVEVQGTTGNYTVKKLYTQPIPLGQ